MATDFIVRGNEFSGAMYSPCEKYRYKLWRKLTKCATKGDKQKSINFIGLNPSTATELKNDPTVARMCRFALDWGFNVVIVTNIFAYRATLPSDMRKQSDPVGIINNVILSQVAGDCDLIVVAWGSHGIHNNRHKEVFQYLPIRKTYCFEITKKGQPKHLLYQSSESKLMPFFSMLEIKRSLEKKYE